MSDVANRVRKIIVERLGVDEANVTDDGSWMILALTALRTLISSWRLEMSLDARRQLMRSK
jgi:hypothetical protein